jgi:hypothetical protein
MIDSSSFTLGSKLSSKMPSSTITSLLWPADNGVTIKGEVFAAEAKSVAEVPVFVVLP